MEGDMAEFSKAIETVLRNEGGYVNNPNDPGGETNFGISKRSFPDVDIRGLKQADAVAIYRTHFWGKYPLLEQLESQEVATKLFDLMVNMGPPRAIRIFQHAINDAKLASVLAEDGHLGPSTVAEANALDAQKLLAAIRDNAARFYCGIVRRKPSQEQFLRTWLLRAYDRPYHKSEPTPVCPPD
jgi:lysozyme family protein